MHISKNANDVETGDAAKVEKMKVTDIEVTENNQTKKLSKGY